MKHYVKRILSLTLALCLCLTLLPSVAMKAAALSPTYSVSSSYKSSSYYTALTNVSLTGNQREDIVNVALSQLGYKEGSYAGDYSGAGNGSYNNYTEYNYWYRNCINSTMSLTSDWCAIFVSWCAVQANIPASILRRSARAGHGSSCFNIKYYSGSSTLADSTDNDSYFSGYNYTPKKGDLFFKRDWTHVGLVVDVSGDYVITVEGNTYTNGTTTGHGVYSLRRPISDLYFGVPDYSGSGSTSTPHTCNKGTYLYYEAAHPHYKWYRCSVCGEEWRNTAETTYISTCETCAPKRTIDSRYSSYLPIKAYTLSTGQVSVYNESGTKYSNHYIDGASDLCTILQIYTDGWCQVNYPTSSGSFTAYVPLSTFTSGTSPTSLIAFTAKTYRRSDLSTALSNVTSSDTSVMLTRDSNRFQIIHKVSGQSYSMMDWIGAYLVTYDANDGSDAPSKQLKFYNTTLTLSSTKPTRIGYSFLGWATSSTATSASYSAGGSFTANADTTLYAVWKANTYTIKYNANGGSGAPASQTKTHGTALTLSTQKPTRTGYTFLGWSTSSSATYQPGDKFTTDANTALYAVWRQDENKIIASDTSIELCVGDNDSKTVYFTPSGSTEVYFGYDTNGASNITCTLGDWENDLCPLTITGSYLGRSKVTVTMYDAATDKILDSMDISVSVSMKIYAIYYNANGGSGAPPKDRKLHGNPLRLSTDIPTRSGYSFLGWATSKNATSAEYQPGDDFSINAATTLYAVWRQLGVADYKYVKPDKTTYQMGESLDLTGFKLTLTYTDGSTNTITDGFSITGFDSSSEGERQFKITYTDGGNLIYVYITYTIENPIVTRKIISYPAKTVYEIGDSLDTTGLKFTLTYADGTSLTLWGAFTTSGFDSTTAGEKEVKVSYNSELVGTFTVTVKAPQSTSAKISMTGATAKAGDTVTVAVNIDSNPGIAGATFSVNYDDALTLESVEDKAVLPGTMIAGQLGTKPYTMLWYGSSNSTKTGCFVVLNFRVADNAKEGSYNVSISCSEASNEKGADVTIPSASAVVTVKSARLPGDVNGDGKVSIKDSVRLAQYLAGWSVTIQSGNADVNGDGKISIKDSVRLAQYLAGWDVVLN